MDSEVIDKVKVDRCRRGHEYTEENTVLRMRNGIWGGRECRICKRTRAQALAAQRGRRTSSRPPSDGIIDEVALERARWGDVAVYEALTRQEVRELVNILADAGPALMETVPILSLRDAVGSELRRRGARRGLLD